MAMRKRKKVESSRPELPSLVLIPTSGFDRPERSNGDYSEVPETAREDILLAVASLLALMDLFESFFSGINKRPPTLQTLDELRRSLEELEKSIIQEYFDAHPTIDTYELATVMEHADALVNSLPGGARSAGKEALRFFAVEIKRRAYEIFDIAIMSICVLEATKAFTTVDQLAYPPR